MHSQKELVRKAVSYLRYYIQLVRPTMKKCWIVGTGLLVLVVVCLGVFVPWWNHRISRIQDDLSALEYDREMRFMNVQLFFVHNLREGQLVTDLWLQKILKDVPSAQAVEAKREKQIATKTLTSLHSALMGEIATPELKEKWADMNTPELHAEVRSMAEREDFTNLYKDIKKKKHKLEKEEGRRTLFIVVATILQVTGLLMISVSQYKKDYAGVGG